MFPKALKSGVDMVCVELEDGIAPKDKSEARQKALNLFSETQPNDEWNASSGSINQGTFWYSGFKLNIVNKNPPTSDYDAKSENA